MKREILYRIKRISERLKEKYDANTVILFGSYARGEETEDSDVDLLVVMNTTASSKERSWAISQLLIPRPFPVDILVRTPREIKQALEGRDFLIEEILTQGKVLYERRA